MAAFKKTVEGGKRGMWPPPDLILYTLLTSSELDSCWAEWMRVQKQIEALGVEVLGHDAFVGNPLHTGYQQKDNQAEMIETEFQRKLEEIEKSIGGIAGELIKEMIKSEKVTLHPPPRRTISLRGPVLTPATTGTRSTSESRAKEPSPSCVRSR